MSSGIKRMKMNTRERVVSNDINQLQQFLGAGVEDALRFMLLGETNREINSDGNAAFISSVTTPLNAVILNGFMCQPQDNTTDLFVTPGVGLFTQPESPHDSNDSFSKLITDPGIQLAGALTFTPNASVNRRVDIVEVQRIDVDLSVQNRDIYNQTTGIFVPNPNIVKIQSARLTYRIRLGTPGAGIPALANGWLPLMVSVAEGNATTWNDTTCWDVRPLVADYIQSPSKSIHEEPENYVDGSGNLVGSSGSGVYNLKVTARSSCKHWKAGGILNGYDPYVDSEPGFSGGISASRIWNLYAVFPRGLPRWCQYTAFSGMAPRIPSGFRGVPVASLTMPSMQGQPLSLITTPAYRGLGVADAADNSVCLLSGGIQTGSTNLTAISANSNVVYSRQALTSPIIGTFVSVSTFDFNLDSIANIFPLNARELLTEIIFTYDVTGTAGTATPEFRVFQAMDVPTPTYSQTFDTLITFSPGFGMLIPQVGGTEISQINIPLLRTPLSGGLSNPRRLRIGVFFVGGLGGTLVNTVMSMRIIGWRY
jgi:hypothetical protein